MQRSMTKAERLREMERLYFQRAYSDIEMGERLGVDRTTVYRDRIELEREIPFTKDEAERWTIDRTRYLSSIRVNLPEALSLYLAARRTSQQTRFAQTHVASALEKLALALRQPMTERLVRAADRILVQRQDPGRAAVFETVAAGWIEGRQLRLVYRALGGERERVHRFAPYLLEPSPWNDGVYLVGQSDLTPQVITLKLERIVEAKLLGPFAPPAGFDEEAMLRHAWGIWGSEQAPQTVKLRFAPGLATRRIKETIWHPLEELTDVEDGGCLWQAPIAEPREMLPFIRGWGADCEVLEPDWLRAEIIRSTQRLAEMYQVVEAKKQFVAHIRKKDKKSQPLMEHLSGVSYLAGQFAQKVGLKEAGSVLGSLHDLAKASDRFQKYILSGEEMIDPDAEEYIDPIAHKGKIDHTTAGAQVVCEELWAKGPKEKIAAQVLALCIASHHSGLIDCITPGGENNFKRRMEKPDESTRKTESLMNLPEIQSTLEELRSEVVVEQVFTKLKSLQEGKDSQETFVFKAGLLIRFLLSCLIDADRLDTADFEMPGNSRYRNAGQFVPWETLIQRLNAKIREFEQKSEKNEVDGLRSQVSQACLDTAQKPKGIYQLTVPTGGGKTLASLRFALHHAKCHEMDRMIYVVPYTSIIDQNAEEIRKILEDKDEHGRYLDRVVLEHHSNLTPEEESHRQNLLAQNWDASVVLTTQVQFLEALFGSGTRSARRMHQLANAVIILDEVQAMPIKVIHMLNVALRFLVHDCGASVVLCTATQPPLDAIGAQYRALTLSSDSRIIPNELELYEKLKRVDVFDKQRTGGWSVEEVADLAEDQLQAKGSVLVVVNTRKSAQALYQAIAAKDMAGVNLYHLSTNMCPIHRLEVLDKIKGNLDPKQNEPVICISTQLIEAGVDIDFGAVIRYLAGLDSIAQSAGRCNRHGIREGLGNVWIVNPRDETLGPLKDIEIGIEMAKRVLQDFNDAPESFGNSRIGLEALAQYYRFYYHRRENEMMYNVGPNPPVGRDDDLFNLLSTNSQSVDAYRRIHGSIPRLEFRQSFHTASKEFHVIDSPTRGVVVPYGKEGKEIIADLCSTPDLDKQYKLLRRAQRYSVNLFSHEFQEMADKGAIQQAQPGIGVYYLDDQYYSEKFGWSIEPVNDLELLIVGEGDNDAE